ncbi:MAG: hypothetical protein IJ193_01705 [Bacilli bacterium]|nr:hypothetical protein [Bacilli bacterium]
MAYRKEQRQIYRLDCIMFVLSCISLVVFTGFYLFVEQDIRDLFLLFDIYGILTLVESVNGIKEYVGMGKIKKCNRIRVNPKLFYTRSRKVEKAI